MSLVQNLKVWDENPGVGRLEFPTVRHSGGNVNKDHNVSVCVSGTAGAAFNLNFRGSVFQGAPADEQVNR